VCPSREDSNENRGENSPQTCREAGTKFRKKSTRKESSLARKKSGLSLPDRGWRVRRDERTRKVVSKRGNLHRRNRGGSSSSSSSLDRKGIESRKDVGQGGKKKSPDDQDDTDFERERKKDTLSMKDVKKKKKSLKKRTSDARGEKRIAGMEKGYTPGRGGGSPYRRLKKGKAELQRERKVQFI